MPETSHAKHDSVHGLSQQRPSTQKPVAQSSADAQSAPRPRLVTHVPLLVSHARSLAHWALVVHVVAQAPALHPKPLAHARRAPCGEPATSVQVPSEPATSHALHCSPHAALQQYPSTHCPLVHSFAPTHAEPFGFLAEHDVPAQ